MTARSGDFAANPNAPVQVHRVLAEISDAGGGRLSRAEDSVLVHGVLAETPGLVGRRRRPWGKGAMQVHRVLAGFSGAGGGRLRRGRGAVQVHGVLTEIPDAIGGRRCRCDGVVQVHGVLTETLHRHRIRLARPRTGVQAQGAVIQTLSARPANNGGRRSRGTGNFAAGRQALAPQQPTRASAPGAGSVANAPSRRRARLPLGGPRRDRQRWPVGGGKHRQPDGAHVHDASMGSQPGRNKQARAGRRLASRTGF